MWGDLSHRRTPHRKYHPSPVPGLASQLLGLEVLRVSLPLARDTWSLSSLSARHLIVAFDTLWPKDLQMPILPDSLHTLTIFITVYDFFIPGFAGWELRWPYSNPTSLHVTIVFRPAPPSKSLEGRDERWRPITLLPDGLIGYLRDGWTFTYVPVTEETLCALGVTNRAPEPAGYGLIRTETPRSLEEAFMRTLENEFDRHSYPDGGDEREVFRRGVRVLSMGEWEAEASKDDLDAYRDFP
jgi:hypothetical protein